MDAREDFWDTFHFLVRNDDELSCDSNYQNHARDVPNGRFRMGMVTRRVDEDNANGLEMCGWC